MLVKVEWHIGDIVLFVVIILTMVAKPLNPDNTKDKFCHIPPFQQPKCQEKTDNGKPHGFFEIGYNNNANSKRWCKSGYSAGGWCLGSKPAFKNKECVNDGHCGSRLYCHGHKCKNRRTKYFLGIKYYEFY